MRRVLTQRQVTEQFGGQWQEHRVRVTEWRVYVTRTLRSGKQRHYVYSVPTLDAAKRAGTWFGGDMNNEVRIVDRAPRAELRLRRTLPNTGVIVYRWKADKKFEKSQSGTAPIGQTPDRA